MRLLLLALVLLGCDRLACVAPATCSDVCGRVGAGTTTWLDRALLDDGCQCVVPCDLGVCSGVPVCPP